MIKKVVYSTAITLILSLFSLSSTTLAQPDNLGLVKREVIQYYESGAYQKEVAKAVAAGKEYLLQRIAANKQSSSPKRLAVILDIDETALSNFHNLKRLNFGGDDRDFIKYAKRADAKVIEPTLSLFKTAIENGVAVFLVTGRMEPLRESTIKNLNKAGYKNWAGLFMLPDGYKQTHTSIVPFKSGERKKIAAQGYDIVLSMGDQKSDLKGKNADKTFLLPNPFYYLQ